MALLLDTHAFLWFIGNDSRLSASAASRIADPQARVFVSVVTAWEIIVKVGTGKLALDRPIAQLWAESIATNGFDVLDVREEHVLALEGLPPHHRDPFDRLLIAQAVAEDCELVSTDSAFSSYPVRILW